MSDTFFLCPNCGDELENDTDLGFFWCESCEQAWQEYEIKPTCVEYFKGEIK